MTPENYNKRTAEISKLLNFPKNIFFDAEHSPFVDEYLSFFEFYEETLKTHSYYGIEPAIIFFANDNRINARATFHDSKYIISINSGTLVWLIQNLLKNENFTKDVEIFKILDNGLDTEINTLLYQTTCHFTFYHEMAHLIQQSEFLESSLDETPNSEPEFNLSKHVLEYDADVFSSLCIGAHIMQYVEKIFGAEYNVIVLESVLVTVSSAIIIYLLSFGANDEEIYYEESTHPHPIIRLTYIGLTISSYCNQNLVATERGFQINEKEVFKKALEVSGIIETKIFENSKIDAYKAIVSDSATEILEYIAKIRTLSAADENLAVNKWNALQ